MRKKLAVIDIDETLIEWELGYPYRFFPRTGAQELLNRLREENIDVVLFTTASIRFAKHVAFVSFKGYEFIDILGSESVTMHNGEKVKDISRFTELGYKLEDIVLVDDKKRNGSLYPDNFIKVIPPAYYSKRNRFDYELLSVTEKIIKFFK